MTTKEKKTNYAPLWILIALSALPYIAGTLYYQYREALPAVSQANYGQLVRPVREIADIQLTLLGGEETDFSQYRKKWLMLYILDRECEESCQKNLYFMRQIRKSMAKDRFRINRLLLLDSQKLNTRALQEILSKYSEMGVATLDEHSKQRFYSTMETGSGNIFGKILLVDPWGNYMMEYEEDPDPIKLLKDVKRLLSVSRIG
ncbi:MAG: hypothetical protein GY784_12110 [Gammaproteobacteria bacterium]|nr:hypothetical protein [Gammaproteobacteria bacterium]